MTLLAKFNLFRHDGLRVWFEVTADTASDADAHIEALLASGYMATEGGIENDETIENITGWVLGESSRGEDVVWLYSDPLQFKVASIWIERIPEMPFSTNGAKKWQASAAPKADEAKNKNFMNTCSFQIVKKLNGKFSDSGHPLSDFDRVYDAAPSKPEQPTTSSETRPQFRTVGQLMTPRVQELYAAPQHVLNALKQHPRVAKSDKELTLSTPLKDDTFAAWEQWLVDRKQDTEPQPLFDTEQPKAVVYG